jgi:hypothetical protein
MSARGSSQRVRRGACSADGTSLVQIQTLGNDHVARGTHVFQDISPWSLYRSDPLDN